MTNMYQDCISSQLQSGRGNKSVAPWSFLKQIVAHCNKGTSSAQLVRFMIRAGRGRVFTVQELRDAWNSFHVNKKYLHVTHLYKCKGWEEPRFKKQKYKSVCHGTAFPMCVVRAWDGKGRPMLLELHHYYHDACDEIEAPNLCDRIRRDQRQDDSPKEDHVTAVAYDPAGHLWSCTQSGQVLCGVNRFVASCHGPVQSIAVSSTFVFVSDGVRVHRFSLNGVACGDVEFGAAHRMLKNPSALFARGESLVVLDGSRVVRFSGSEPVVVREVDGVPRSVCLDSEGHVLYCIGNSIKRLSSTGVTQNVVDLKRGILQVSAVGEDMLAVMRDGDVLKVGEAAPIARNVMSISSCSSSKAACLAADGTIHEIVM